MFVLPRCPMSVFCDYYVISCKDRVSSRAVRHSGGEPYVLQDLKKIGAYSEHACFVFWWESVSHLICCLILLMKMSLAVV